MEIAVQHKTVGVSAAAKRARLTFDNDVVSQATITEREAFANVHAPVGRVKPVDEQSVGANADSDDVPAEEQGPARSEAEEEAVLQQLDVL